MAGWVGFFLYHFPPAPAMACWVVAFPPRHHSSSVGVKVKDLLTWPPRIIDCGVTRCDCVRMHVTLWLHTAGSAGVVWKHLQFKGPLGALLYSAGFVSFLFWMEQEDRCEFLKRDAQTAGKSNLFCWIWYLWMTVHIVFYKWPDWVGEFEQYILLSLSQ